MSYPWEGPGHVALRQLQKKAMELSLTVDMSFERSFFIAAEENPEIYAEYHRAKRESDDRENAAILRKFGDYVLD